MSRADPARRMGPATANLALAFACALAGWASHLVSPAPTYATPIWLPAGIALGALLAGGYRLWSGVWLGTFAITAWQLRSVVSPGTAVAAGAAIAGGAALQAVAGRWLLLRSGERTLPLQDAAPIWRFILLCGPLASLISASIGTATLLVAGRITLDSAPPDAVAWWIGDTLGVLLVAPALLALVGRPAALWWPRRLTVGLPLLAAAALIFGVFAFAGWLDRGRHEAEFNRHATLLASALRTAIDFATDSSGTLGTFLRASDTVEREKFSDFAAGILARRAGSRALEWVPRVPRGELAAHERAARADGVAGYAVFERDATGRQVPPADRAEYFPVRYIVPLAGNEQAYGYDLGSEPARRATIERARTSGRTTLSPRIRLVQEPGLQYGVLALTPVYTAADDGPGGSLRGLALSVIRMGELADAALAGNLPDGIAFRIDDLDAPAGEELLVAAGTPNPGSPLRNVVALDVGGRHWQLSFAPTDDFLLYHRERYALLTYLGVLALSGMLSSFLLILSGRSMRIEQLVAERTADLEAARRDAERASGLLEEAVGSLAQGFTIYDEHDRLVMCNDAYRDLHQPIRSVLVPGMPFEAIAGEAARHGLYKAAAGRPREWLAERLAQHQRADGRVFEEQLGDGRWLRVVEHRTPSGFIAGNRIDITDLKQATSQLQDRNAQLDAVFTLSPDGFVALGADGRVNFVNPAFTAMTAIAPTDVVGRDEQALDAALAARVEQPERFAGVAGYFGAAGSPPQFHLLRLRSPRDTMLQIVGLRSRSAGVPRILYLRDVTSEAEVDRMKSEFLSHAAHELRTPMASIYGFSELLLETELDEATKRDLVETIHRQTRWLVDIINELLDLARIEARRGRDFRIVAVDLAALVRETAASLAFDRARWPVALDLPPWPMPVPADAAKARQALINVLANAQKYSPEGGRIDVELVVGEGRIGIVVADQGIGMTPQQLERFGERFWRADTSGKTPGTGLGMAIVKEILELHGGEVAVSSSAGVGTTVTLWWPTRALARTAGGEHDPGTGQAPPVVTAA